MVVPKVFHYHSLCSAFGCLHSALCLFPNGISHIIIRKAHAAPVLSEHLVECHPYVTPLAIWLHGHIRKGLLDVILQSQLLCHLTEESVIVHPLPHLPVIDILPQTLPGSDRESWHLVIKNRRITFCGSVVPLTGVVAFVNLFLKELAHLIGCAIVSGFVQLWLHKVKVLVYPGSAILRFVSIHLPAICRVGREKTASVILAALFAV